MTEDDLTTASARAVEHAITSRRAIRAFLPTPVDPVLVRRLIAVAAQSPSGTNMQPWKLRVIGPRTRERLEAALIAALESGEMPAEEEYRYYPQTFREPYLSRRRKVGWDLYGLLGVAKGDTAGMKRQSAANLRFFGAPVALMLTVDRDLEIGSWLDLGMFVQSLLIAAQAHGLQSCPQAIFARFHPIVRRELFIPDSEVVVCGIAIGHADPDAPQNSLVPEREPVEGFTTWLD